MGVVENRTRVVREPAVPVTARPAGATDGIGSARYRVTTAGIIGAITLTAFEAMAVATALPAAARGVHGVSGYGWLFTGFLVANMVGMVVGGGLTDQRGPRRPAVIGLVGFVVGLLVAGFATTLPILVAARVVQGLSTGLLFIALYVVIGERYPTALQPRMMAALSSAWVVPSLIGPVIAGLLTQTVGWRWVFWGIAPFVVIAAVMLVPALRTMPSTPRPGGRPWRSRLVLALVVAVGVAVFQEAGHVGLGVAPVVAAVGLAVVVAGLWRLLPAGWWKVAPGVAGPVVLRGFLAAAFFGLDALIPLMLQTQHRFNSLEAGLPLTCGAVAWAVGSFIQGRERWTIRQRVRLMQGGLGLITVAAVGLAVVAQPFAWGWAAAVSQTLAGLGVGLGMTAVSVLLLRFTTDADRGRDSSSMQLCDTTGAALSTGLGGVLVATAAGGAIAYGAAFAIADLAMAAVAAVGVFVAGRLRPAT